MPSSGANTDHAYRLGLAGRALPARLATSGDEDVMAAWREGKADRPEDQPTTARSPGSAPRRTSPRPGPSSPGASTPRSTPRKTAASSPSLFGRAKRGAEGGAKTLVTGGNRRYSLVIAVEWLVCVVLIALSGAGVGSDQDAPAFSDPAIALVRLTAVSLLFFLLALLSAGERIGKLAAAFGGLVTLGVAFNAVGEWTAIANVFGGGSSSSAEPGTGPQPGQMTPIGGGRYET